MPTADQHRRKAERNRQFLAVIAVDDHPEWAVTVAFYTAVHRIEQLRAATGDGHSPDHTDRLDYVRVRHPAVFDPLDWLYKASRLARYHAASEFFNRYDADRVRDEVIAGWLVAVEAYVAQQLVPPETSV